MAGRSLTWLGVITLALLGILVGGIIWSSASWAPKLALDLEGGTQMILKPNLEGGEQATPEQLAQAVSIIRQRVDASGVSEAEVNTEGNNVVVSIPGEADEETRKRIEASAKLEFRAVLVAGQPSNTFVGEDGTETPYPSPDPALPNTPTAEPTSPSDLSQITPALEAQFQAFDCNEPVEPGVVQPADEPIIACEADGSVKYILGPVEVEGSKITDATNGMRTTQTGATTGEWAVNLVFNGQGTDQFAEVTSRLNGLESPQNQFAIVLDNQVISAPQTLAVISDGKPEISGNFTQESSKTLADQLKYGALPISFVVQSSDQISATLGSSQLEIGIIAGLIGLAYYVVLEAQQGKTLGKMALGLRVTDLDGNRIGFGRATARHFGKFISAMILMIGFIMAGFTKRKQALHDIMAGCLVVARSD